MRVDNQSVFKVACQSENFANSTAGMVTVIAVQPMGAYAQESEKYK
jgi:hypothetical protein